MSMIPELPFDVMLEAIVCVLLLATIGYCAVIDRRLRAMRAGQDGLRVLVHDLNTATERAATAIHRLKETNDVTGRELGERVARARALADELGMMVESGNGIADRLASIDMRRVARTAASQQPQPQPVAGPRQAPAQASRPAAAPQTRGGLDMHPLLDALKRAR
ncbi:MAG: hypothetical protein GC184_15330 [Rhizobiales bacterium]|nr:hypothetical protein [Hyphomicrobiales bacterium]